MTNRGGPSNYLSTSTVVDAESDGDIGAPTCGWDAAGCNASGCACIGCAAKIGVLVCAVYWKWCSAHCVTTVFSPLTPVLQFVACDALETAPPHNLTGVPHARSSWRSAH